MKKIFLTGVSGFVGKAYLKNYQKNMIYTLQKEKI